MHHRHIAAILLAAGTLVAQSGGLNDGEAHGDPPFLLEKGWRALLNGKDLAGWRPQDNKPSAWFTTRGVRWEPVLSPNLLAGIEAPSGVILNGPKGRTANLVTEEKFGDIELYLDFLIPKGSNSGVYLHGLYEIQVFDSYGSGEKMKTSDCGGVYHRWIDNKGVGGSAPSQRQPPSGRMAEFPDLVPWPAV
jgi:hypothetical protein